MAKPKTVPLLKKRTVILDTDQIEFITESGRASNREFSAQLRTIIDAARLKKGIADRLPQPSDL